VKLWDAVGAHEANNAVGDSLHFVFDRPRRTQRICIGRRHRRTTDVADEDADDEAYYAHYRYHDQQPNAAALLAGNRITGRHAAAEVEFIRRRCATYRFRLGNCVSLRSVNTARNCRHSNEMKSEIKTCFESVSFQFHCNCANSLRHAETGRNKPGRFNNVYLTTAQRPVLIRVRSTTLKCIADSVGFYVLSAFYCTVIVMF